MAWPYDTIVQMFQRPTNYPPIILLNNYALGLEHCIKYYREHRDEWDVAPVIKGHALTKLNACSLAGIPKSVSLQSRTTCVIFLGNVSTKPLPLRGMCTFFMNQPTTECVSFPYLQAKFPHTLCFSDKASQHL
jgi:hypothetical protein